MIFCVVNKVDVASPASDQMSESESESDSNSVIQSYLTLEVGTDIAPVKPSLDISKVAE